MKRIVIVLYMVVIAVMAGATMVENSRGTAFIGTAIYGAWWFSALWGLLTAAAVIYFLSRRVRRPSTVALHTAFVIILLGALLTHLTARQGILHLRTGDTTDRYVTPDQRVHHLPFALTLDSFQVQYHVGTQAPSDFRSHLTILDGQERRQTVVSMNHIAAPHGVRLYQSSYDEDGRGSVLSVNSDPWGIPVTYTGYALLFLSLLWMLIDPRGTFRQLLRQEAAPDSPSPSSEPVRKEPSVLPSRHPMGRGRSLMELVISSIKDRSLIIISCLGFLVIMILSFIIYSSSSKSDSSLPTERVGRGSLPIKTMSGEPLPSIPPETADRMGRVLMVHNDRVCPVETYALDFTKKLCGQRSYDGYTPVQVLAGFIFYYDQWAASPIVRAKVKHPEEREYLLTAIHTGRPLRLFPYTDRGHIIWYAPTDELPATMDPEHRRYMRELFTLLNGAVQDADWDVVDRNLERLQQYQHTFGGTSVPGVTRLRAEHLYNRVPFATILFMVCLFMGLLAFLATAFGLTGKRVTRALNAVMALCLLALTMCLALRWVITGNVPMANGYETQLVLAWMILLVTMVLRRWAPLMQTFGFLLAGFCLLVSHLAQMNPQMTPLMPVLQSPLLTLHVSVIMMAYALLSLTALCGITYFIGQFRNWTISRLDHSTVSGRSTQEKLSSSLLSSLSRLFLYPAIVCLGIGIFIGAIWANVSWGTYWSWDPKETWALITFMVYAVPLHGASLPGLRRPAAYHAYMVFAFLTLLMTYFGVNYLFGGMHSYGGG